MLRRPALELDPEAADGRVPRWYDPRGMTSVRDELLRACPSDESVALFLAGALAPEDEVAFREHLDGCSPCRGLLVEAGRAESRLPETRVKELRVPTATPPPANALAIGDVIGGKYRIESMRGYGGMGRVFRGWHLGLSRTVAIKVMHTELFSPDLARRFFREARAAASLTSQHAVRILDIDHLPGGIPYIVMEHLEGRDLNEVILADGPLPWGRAVDYVLMAAEAIGEAHALGIIHRDLKPHNLFLTGDGVVKVLDFGLAKLLPSSVVEGSSGNTKGTALLGSPQYMAPEQIRAASTVDARTDVYGLGATMYQLLTGLAPFLGLNLYVLCARILSEPPAPLSRSRKDVPAAVEAVVMRCLEKLPAARFATAEELAAALRDARSRPETGRAVTDFRRTEPVVEIVTQSAPTKPSGIEPAQANTQRELDGQTERGARQRPSTGSFEMTQKIAPMTEAQPTPRTDRDPDAPPMTERMPDPPE